MPLISRIFFSIVLFAVITTRGEEINFHGNRKYNPVIFNFGDSNSDTGGFSAALGLDYEYPYGRILTGQPAGRVSDGRLIIDFLCDNASTNHLSPYLDSLEPNFANGANFAINGAVNLPKYERLNLGVQIRQYKRFRNHSVEKDLIGDRAFEKALYMFDIGQNDLSYSFGAFPYERAVDRIPSIIDVIRDSISTIYEIGGRNFWVHNTGPLGCLPRELSIQNSTNPDDFDDHGCSKALNYGAKLFNSMLRALTEELRSQMENSTIVYVDVYSIKYDLIANAKSYGFKYPLMACYGYGGPPYNFDPKRNCLDRGCPVSGEDTLYISWDGTHYTEAANSFVAPRILSTQYSTPPLQFNFPWNDDRVVYAM